MWKQWIDKCGSCHIYRLFHWITWSIPFWHKPLTLIRWKEISSEITVISLLTSDLHQEHGYCIVWSNFLIGRLTALTQIALGTCRRILAGQVYNDAKVNTRWKFKRFIVIRMEKYPSFRKSMSCRCIETMKRNNRHTSNV